MDITGAKWRIIKRSGEGFTEHPRSHREGTHTREYELVYHHQVLATIEATQYEYWRFRPYIEEELVRANAHGDRYNMYLGKFTTLPAAKQAVLKYFNDQIGLPDREGR